MLGARAEGSTDLLRDSKGPHDHPSSDNLSLHLDDAVVVDAPSCALHHRSSSLRRHGSIAIVSLATPRSQSPPRATQHRRPLRIAAAIDSCDDLQQTHRHSTRASPLPPTGSVQEAIVQLRRTVAAPTGQASARPHSHNRLLLMRVCWAPELGDPLICLRDRAYEPAPELGSPDCPSRQGV